MQGRVLIACVGNIFLGDDGFGAEVAQRLMHEGLPDHIAVRDFGIRSYDLAYALMEDWNLVILVDAVSRGGAPGTVYTIRPGTNSSLGVVDLPDAHSMNPENVIHLVRALGGDVSDMLVVGCEPANIELDETGRIGLSPAVAAAVGEAIRVIQGLVSEDKRSIAA